MNESVGAAFRAKAEREATRLLDEYGVLADTHEGVHALIALGYMLGSQDGSREATDLAIAELQRALIGNYRDSAKAELHEGNADAAGVWALLAIAETLYALLEATRRGPGDSR